MILIRILLFIMLPVAVLSQVDKRVAFADSIANSKKWKSINKIPYKDERNVITSYEVSKRDKNVWFAGEYRRNSYGFKKNKTTNFLYYKNELIAVFDIELAKHCKSCVNSYYFDKGILIFKKEPNGNEDVSEFLKSSLRHLVKYQSLTNMK